MSLQYLLQPRESIRNKEFVYKVGRTCKEGLQRFDRYPKGSRLIIQMLCMNSIILEKQIIDKFNSLFENSSMYGKEYFKGDVTDMISIVLKEVATSFNCEIDMKRKI